MMIGAHTRRNPPAPLLGAAALSVAMLVAACGGSGSLGATSSKAFLASANHVCGIYYHRGHSLAPPIGFEQFAELLEKQQALRQHELSGLQSVTSPPAVRARYQRYLSDMKALGRLEAPIANQGKSLYLALARRYPTLRSQHDLAVEGFRRSSEEARRAYKPPPSSRAQQAKIPGMEKLQSSLYAQARALGLTECAKNPYTAEHTYVEEGPVEGTAARP
jgi:hypothetical protein